jgi:hypothetical protein
MLSKGNSITDLTRNKALRNKIYIKFLQKTENDQFLKNKTLF